MLSLTDLPILAEAPAGCILFPVPMAGAPDAFCPIKFAIVDTADRQPRRGTIFLIQWSTGARAIVQLDSSPDDLLALPYGRSWLRSQMPKDHMWFVFNFNLPQSETGAEQGPKRGASARASDGPYEMRHLAEKLVGCVIGVLFGEKGSDTIASTPPEHAVQI